MKAITLAILLLTFQQAFAMSCDVAVSGAAPVSLDQVVQEKIKTFSLTLKSSLLADGNQTQSLSAVVRSLSRNAISDSMTNTAQVAKFITPVAGTETNQTVQSVIQSFAQLKSGDFKKGWGFGKKKAEAEVRGSIVTSVSTLKNRLPVVTERLLEVRKNLVLIEGSVAQLKAEMQVLEAVKKTILTKKVAESGRINISEVLLQIQDIENLIQGTLKTLSDQKQTLSKLEVILESEQTTLVHFLETQLDQLNHSVDKDADFAKNLAIALKGQSEEAAKAAVMQALAKSKGTVLTPELLETPFRPLMHGDQVKVIVDEYSDISEVFSAQVEVDGRKRKKLVFWAQKFNFLNAEISRFNPPIREMKWPLDHNGYFLEAPAPGTTYYRYGRNNIDSRSFRIILANPEMKIDDMRIGDKLKIKFFNGLMKFRGTEWDLADKILKITSIPPFNLYHDKSNREEVLAMFQSLKFEVLGTANDHVVLSINLKETHHKKNDVLLYIPKNEMSLFFKPVSKVDEVTN